MQISINYFKINQSGFSFFKAYYNSHPQYASGEKQQTRHVQISPTNKYNEVPIN